MIQFFKEKEHGMIDEILNRLEKKYPDAGCELDHRNVFELLVCVVLSAQTTDKRVNMITPELFSRYPDAASLSEADASDVEECLRTIGMYRQKAKNIIGLSKILMEEYDGKVPESHEELMRLPGVGRKTANVVMSEGFGYPAIAVDTHVFRVSNRIGMADADNVLDTELQLQERIPRGRWSKAHHLLIFHGRYTCAARKPKCEECPLIDLCRYYREAH